MRLPIFVISLSLLTACEGAQMREGHLETERGSAAAAADVNSGTSPSAPTKISDPAPAVGNSTDTSPATYAGAEMPMPDAAYIPISIGGASLTCSLSSHDSSQANCFATKVAGQPFKFSATKAFFIDSKEKVWFPTNLFETAPGSWNVKLPFKADNKSFAIGLSDDKFSIMMDWVANTADPLAKGIADGSFEAVLYDGTIATQMLDSAHQKDWKAISKIDGCESVVEVGNSASMYKEVASDGNQFIELDTACHANNLGNAGNNSIIFQDLKTKVDHIYEISFQYKGRIGAKRKQELQVRWGGENILKTVVTNESWQTYKFISRTSKENIRIEFEESGVNDGTGTLIDNVIVTDGGGGPT